MPLLRRAIHFGCSEGFKRHVESLVDGEALFNGISHRDLDFAEIFSGCGHLSQQLWNAACL